MSNKQLPRPEVQRPSDEVLAEVHRRTEATKSGLPGLDNLLTLDQALLIALNADPLPSKKPHH